MYERMANIMSQTDAELREKLFQAPDEWFDAHTMGGEVECVHLTDTGIEAIVQLVAARDIAIRIEAKIEENDYHWHHQKHITKQAGNGTISMYFIERKERLETLRHESDQAKEKHNG